MTIYTLDDSRPFLARNGAVIKWESGDVAAQITSSRLVRIYSRGVSFVPLGWKAREWGSAYWSTEDPCWPSRDGLCKTGNGTVFFPTSRLPLVNQRLWDWRCKGKSTGRALTDLTVYEASACDVLDAGYDFVYSDGRIMYRDGSMPDWVYWSICVLVIFLVRCLSKYILASVARDSEESKKGDLPSVWICMAACVAATVLVTYQGDSCFVTREDLVFYWFSVTYVCFYTALFLVSRTASAFTSVHVPFSSLRDPPFYNLLAGVLQLVATRFYFSAHTPYNPPIIFIVGVRALTKSRRKLPDVIRSCTLLFDGFMLSLLCVLGFWEDREYLVALFCAAMAWADFLI